MQITQQELNSRLENHIRWLMDDTSGERLDLSSADLKNANLIYAILRYANLIYAILRYADLRGVDLSGADLTGADLIDVNLTGADLEDANLRYAKLNGADLKNANLKDADLTGADLNNVDLSGVAGKEIITFKGSKHFAYSCDGNIRIGCRHGTVGYWLENYKEIGKDQDYSDLEIEEYGNFIRGCLVKTKEEVI